MPPTRSLNRKLGIIVAMVIVAVIGGVLWLANTVPAARTEAGEPQSAVPVAPAVGEPEIVGSSRFRAQVQEALRLLKGRDPDAYAIVTKYVGRIQESDRSGMWAYKTPPTYEMSERTAFYSLTWCAATIAHDSFHSKLYHDYRAANHGPVPDAVWTGKVAEGECMKHQVAVMNRIGASKLEIDHAKARISGDYVKDSETWEDHRKRRW
jgi:hypothetical protein